MIISHVRAKCMAVGESQSWKSKLRLVMCPPALPDDCKIFTNWKLVVTCSCKTTLAKSFSSLSKIQSGSIKELYCNFLSSADNKTYFWTKEKKLTMFWIKNLDILVGCLMLIFHCTPKMDFLYNFYFIRPYLFSTPSGLKERN